MIVAIDGPAASGKGTLARRIAAHFGLPHLDTGLLYRATARALIDRGARLSDEAAATEAAKAVDPAAYSDEALRGAEMGEAASIVAAIPAVRGALLDVQRRFAAQPAGAVLDGRDIGTVICPDADIKLFVTASPEARGERRFRELLGRGEPVDLGRIVDDIRQRDARDASRSAAPLAAAADAVTIDTSAMGIEEVFAEALRLIGTRHPRA